MLNTFQNFSACRFLITFGVTLTFATILLLSPLILSSFKRIHPLVHAERLESNSYVIQFGNFNVTSGQKSSATYSVTDTVGQVGAGPYGEYGSSTYFVGGGFQYIYQIDEFIFQISKTDINLGTLVAGIHNTDDHTLTVSTRNQGYQVYAFEQHPLRHEKDNSIIPDTTCDNNDCDQTTATSWSNQSIPGFGFNMSGDDIPTDFVNTNYFRQFANRAGSEEMQVVMSSPNVVRNSVATVTYKAGVSGSQSAGQYETAIEFVAVPSY